MKRIVNTTSEHIDSAAGYNWEPNGTAYLADASWDRVKANEPKIRGMARRGVLVAHDEPTQEPESPPAPVAVEVEQVPFLDDEVTDEGEDE